MVEPTGYTALDLIGFTDRGSYDPLANYVRNDLVHVGNSTWRCKIDDTTGITPTEGANWTIFIESATSLSGMSDVDLNTPKAGDGLVHDGNDWTNVPIMTQAMQGKLGAKNKARITATTQIVDGITYTIDQSAGTVIASGSLAAGKTSSYLAIGKVSVVAGDILTGCPIGGGSSNYELVILNSSQTARIAADIGNGFVAISTDANAVLGIYIRRNLSSAIRFEPMVRIAEDTDGTFAPYAKTNRELTEELGTELYSHTVQSSETFRTVLNDLWNNCINSFTGDKSRLKLIWRRTSLGLDYQCPVKIKGGTYLTFGIFGVSSSSESFYQQYQVMSSGSSFLTMTFNTNGTIASYDNSTNNANVGDKFIIAYQ